MLSHNPRSCTKVVGLVDADIAHYLDGLELLLANLLSSSTSPVSTPVRLRSSLGNIPAVEHEHHHRQPDNPDRLLLLQQLAKHPQPAGRCTTPPESSLVVR